MKKLLLLSACCLFLSQHTFSQSIFWYNKQVINPAFTGMESNTEVNVLGSSEFNFRINTTQVNASQRIKQLHGAIGAQYYLSTTPLSYVQGGGISYAFHQTTKIGTFSYSANYTHSQLKFREPYAQEFLGTYDPPQLDVLNVGIAYKRNHLNAGIAFSSQFTTRVYLDYRWQFTQNIAITPRAFFAIDRNQYAGLLTALEFDYKEKIAAGFGTNPFVFSSVYFFVGYRFNSKASFMYQIGGNRSLLNNGQTGINHSVALSFKF